MALGSVDQFTLLHAKGLPYCSQSGEVPHAQVRERWDHFQHVSADHQACVLCHSPPYPSPYWSALGEDILAPTTSQPWHLSL